MRSDENTFEGEKPSYISEFIGLDFKPCRPEIKIIDRQYTHYRLTL